MSDRTEALDADRVRLEAAIAEATPSALPALVREHRILLAELEALSGPVKGSIKDELAAKRAAREAGAAGTAPSAV